MILRNKITTIANFSKVDVSENDTVMDQEICIEIEELSGD